MRGLELKNSVDNLLKRSTSVDETTPINLAKNKTTDHGTIVMDRTLSADDIYKNSAGNKSLSESKEPKDEEKPKGMSLVRKCCFVLSFNGGILYVVAFAWLIPCRLSPCLLTEDKWTTNLTNLQITSNLETNALIDPTLVIFGHIDEGGGNIKALKVANASEAWNNTLQGKPLQVRCNLKMNEKICFVTGTNYIASLHSENGSVIWSRPVDSPDESAREIFLTQEKGNQTYLVAVSEDDLHIFDTVDGSEVATSPLPCAESEDVKIAGPWLSKKGYIWALVCQSEQGIEAYTFRERELLSFRGNDSEPESLDVNFKSLLSKQSYRGSIDLACDVTTTPDSLVLSWADMVTMVTAQAPFHHFQKTWERRFSSPLTVAVTSITTGHFVGTTSTEIAVCVQEGSNSTIHILEEKNGTSLAELEFGSKRLVSIKKLAGADGEKDALLIESIEDDSSSNASSSEFESRSFYMLEYEGDKSVLRLITKSEGYIGSSLSQISSGKSNLLLASSDRNRNIILDRFIIQNKDPEKTWCKDEKNANTSIVMYLE